MKNVYNRADFFIQPFNFDLEPFWVLNNVTPSYCTNVIKPDAGKIDIYAKGGLAQQTIPLKEVLLDFGNFLP